MIPRVEGERNDMTTSTIIAADSARTRTLPLLMASFLGLFVVGFAGFSQMDIVHNAGHDYRHSMAFPCH